MIPSFSVSQIIKKMIPTKIIKRVMIFLALFVALMSGLCFSNIAFASGNNGLNIISAINTASGQNYSVNVEVLLVMTLLGLLPLMVLMMTSFTRFIIVLSILRQALGLQQSPPNKILTGIALALTILVMRPVWMEVYNKAVIPYQNEEITLKQALNAGETPLKKFMLAQTRKKSLEQIMSIAHVKGKAEAQSLSIVVPAYILSELKTAFQLGFMIYIPFLVIDLIVSSVLMAMGMMMLSPLIISLPFKLMLFVLCDGWSLVTGALTSSIQGFH